MKKIKRNRSRRMMVVCKSTLPLNPSLSQESRTMTIELSGMLPSNWFRKTKNVKFSEIKDRSNWISSRIRVSTLAQESRLDSQTSLWSWLALERKRLSKTFTSSCKRTFWCKTVSSISSRHLLSVSYKQVLLNCSKSSWFLLAPYTLVSMVQRLQSKAHISTWPTLNSSSQLTD